MPSSSRDAPSSSVSFGGRAASRSLAGLGRSMRSPGPNKGLLEPLGPTANSPLSMAAAETSRKPRQGSVAGPSKLQPRQGAPADAGGIMLKAAEANGAEANGAAHVEMASGGADHSPAADTPQPRTARNVEPPDRDTVVSVGNAPAI